MTRRWDFIWIGLVVTIGLVGCETAKNEYQVQDYESPPSQLLTTEILEEGKLPSRVIEKVITDEKVVSLTFQGMGTEESLGPLLDVLDEYQIKATFFVSGIEVAEDPALANKILQMGHQLGNATLSGSDLTTLKEDEILTEILRSHQEIVKHTGVEPTYLRVGQRGFNEDVLRIAAACGYDDIIDYTVNPQDWDGKTAEEIATYINRFKQRGSILILNARKNDYVSESIPLIYETLAESGFQFVPLDHIVNLYKEQQESVFTLSENWYEVEAEKEFLFIEEGNRHQKKIALTFDDWASDDTVDSILDTLDEFNVKATFFLIGKGVEANPSLAYAISERGHEVASHTYNHFNLDTLSDQEIKDEIIKAHEVISSAIGKEAKRYLRPPRGIMNDEIAQIISDCNYDGVIMYGPSALDWDVTNTADDITNYMLNHTYNGAILLLHILDGIATPEALPHILAGLLDQGYEFVTVSELIEEQ